MRRGAKLISTKWVDTNKGTTESPNIRCRLVARGVRRRREASRSGPGSRNQRKLKYQVCREVRMIHSNSTTGGCVNSQNSRKPIRVGSIDVRRAYFYANARRKIYIENPTEDWQCGDEDHVAVGSVLVWDTGCRAKLVSRSLALLEVNWFSQGNFSNE